jgi:serine/threonine protein kinase
VQILCQEDRNASSYACSTSSNTCSTIAEGISDNSEQNEVDYVLSPMVSNEELCEEAVTSVQRGGFETLRRDIQVIRRIGEGDFGIVFEGQFRGRKCAVKMVKQELNRTSEQSQQIRDLLMEMAILASIPSHPNVVGFVGACIDDLKIPLIIEEFVDGENLEDYLSPMPICFELGRAKVRSMPLRYFVHRWRLSHLQF